MSNRFERENGLNPFVDDSQDDRDNDGLKAIEEFSGPSLAFLQDSDNDGLSDSEEVTLYLTSPMNADTDLDGIPDGFEVLYNLNPLNSDDAALDADDDGFTNLQEYLVSTNVFDKNSAPSLIFDDFEGDLIPVRYTTGGDAPFALSTTASVSGMQSLRSGEVLDEQYSFFSFNSEELGSALLEFELKVSSESNYDFFLLAFDNQVQYSISGEVDWQTVRIIIPVGTKEVKFIYAKDFIVSQGDDAVWIDDIKIINFTEVDADQDGIRDQYEQLIAFSLDGDLDSEADNDNDSLTNLEEYQAGSDPRLQDTDNDGRIDSEELTLGTDPRHFDTDRDGIADGFEVNN
ncbi:MAG: hypothetical protein OXE99_13030, partial [Cellvibrionales bacterium]|nr:hypothetical protein [Cellvibrionales bacterium]